MPRMIEPSPYVQGASISDKKRRRQQPLFRNVGPQVAPAKKKRITPAAPGSPAAKDVPTINVSPLRRPGKNDLPRAKPSESLAVQVAAARPESQVLPGGQTPDQRAVRDEARQAKAVTMPTGASVKGGPSPTQIAKSGPGWSIKGGLTPEADRGKGPVVEIPKIPMPAPRQTGQAPSVSQQKAAGLDVIAPPAGYAEKPKVPAPDWQRISPAASAEYAAQAGGQVQVAKPPAPAPAAAPTAGAPKITPAAPPVSEVDAASALEGSGITGKRKEWLLNQARRGDPEAVKVVREAQAKQQAAAKAAETAKLAKATGARADRAAEIAVQDAEHQEANTRRTWESAGKKVQDLTAELKKLQSSEYPEEKAGEIAQVQQRLQQAQQELATAQSAYTEAQEGTKTARGTRAARYSGTRPYQPITGGLKTTILKTSELLGSGRGKRIQPAAPGQAKEAAEVPGSSPVAPRPLPPEGTPTQSAARKAGKKVGQAGMREIDRYVDSMMYGEYEADPIATGMMRKDPRNPGLLADADLYARGGPKYGTASVEALDKGLKRLRGEFSYVRLGVSKAEAEHATKAAFVSWLATNEERYPEAVAAWKKKYPTAWKTYAPAASLDTGPGKALPKGRGQKITRKVAEKYYDKYEDKETARQKALADGWVM